jgi:imidazolonepropionase-like amidohydrolase
VAGTDGPGGCLPPGAIALELEELVAAGLPPLAALRTATRNAADAYGADSLGRVAVGAVADLVLLDSAVLTDIGRVRAPWLVIRSGRIVAGTRMGGG